MRVETYESHEQLPAPAVAALSYRHGVRFFHSIDWFGCLLRHGFDTETPPRIYLASDDDGPQCALFCAVKSPGHLTSLSNFYTMEYGPIGIGERGAEGLAAIARVLATERWHTIDLRAMRRDERAQLDAALSAAGFSCYPYLQYDNWYLEVRGRSFEEYYSALGSRLRNTIRRKGKKLKRDHEHTIDIYPVDDVSFDDAIAVYEHVYASSWKNPEPFPAFMPALFSTCDQLGIARIGVARIDGNPAAAQIWINDHGRTVIYKLAYDEQYAPMSIGSLLSYRLFEHAIDNDQVHEIDYGVGSESYKRDWMNARRESWSCASSAA